MTVGNSPLLEGSLEINADQTRPPVLVTETYHSTIELGMFNARVAVIKTCRDQNDPQTVQRFRAEVDALRLVGSHTHITQLFCADISRLALTLRAELGQSLDKYVDSHGRSTLSSGDSTTLWKQMSSALAHVHANFITHDDVKPDNIMWDPATCHSVLIDFGAALNRKVLPTDWFNPSGTPPYAPPEFLRRKKQSAGDVWSLGVTMLFAFKYIKLPDGDWILPQVFEEAPVLEEMKRWLNEVEGWRTVLLGRDDSLLAEMLEQDPDKRIVAAELVVQLDIQEIRNVDWATSGSKHV